MVFNPSKYQQAIFDEIEHGTGNIFISARAGSGKTTVLEKGAKRLPRNCEAAFVAFNKIIADELGKRLASSGSTMKAMTLHAMGMGILRTMGKRLTVNKFKYGDLCRDYVKQYEEFLRENEVEMWQVVATLKKLVEMAMLNLTNLTEKDLMELADHYEIEVYENDPEWPILWQGVGKVIQLGIEEAQNTGKIDFNDMVYLPTALKLVEPKYDVIMVDEAQDLSAALRNLVLKSIKKTGRMIFCGDPWQAIQGFAGADTDSVTRIIEATNAIVLPLPICYRCPKSHVRLCQAIVPDMEYAPDAPEGIIDHVVPEKLWEVVQPGDLVMCRTVKPLVKMCFELLRHSIKAKVRGREIGKGFVNTVKKIKKQNPGITVVGLADALEEYREQQAAVIGSHESKAMKLEALHDKVDTMQVLLQSYATSNRADIEGFMGYIEDMFSDETGGFVVFSTVHKAKGLEENRTFILKQELMPHPRARGEWQLKQEMHIRYVALSRAKYDATHQGELYFVDYERNTPTEEPVEPEKPVELPKQEELTVEQVGMLVKAAGAGRAIIDWHIDYSVGAEVLGSGEKCIWNLKGHRITASLIDGGGYIISESKEPDPIYPLLERKFLTGHVMNKVQDAYLQKKGIR